MTIKRWLAVGIAAFVFVANPSSAQDTTRTTVKLDWEHLPRTGDMVVLQAAKMPASTIYYAVFASGTRVIRVYWDAGTFCKGAFSPAEEPLMECGTPTRYFRITQPRGGLPFVELVLVATPQLPPGVPG